MNSADSKIYDLVLIALRQIMRAFDIQSKYLEKYFGLTGSQLLILQELSRSGESKVGDIAKRISLSQATVTNILDRLEGRGLVRKRRSEIDKRKVMVLITDSGKAILEKNPSLLQDRFIEKFKTLPQWEQTYILSVIQRIVSMMDADEIRTDSDFISNSDK